MDTARLSKPLLRPSLAVCVEVCWPSTSARDTRSSLTSHDSSLLATRSYHIHIRLKAHLRTCHACFAAQLILGRGRVVRFGRGAKACATRQRCPGTTVRSTAAPLPRLSRASLAKLGEGVEVAHEVGLGSVLLAFVDTWFGSARDNYA